MILCAGQIIPQNLRYYWRNISAFAQACFPWITNFFPFFSSFLSFHILLVTSFCFSFLTGLSKKIMRGIALALGGSPYEFEGDRAGDAFWVMRLIGYPAARSTDASDIPKNDVGW